MLDAFYCGLDPAYDGSNLGAANCRIYGFCITGSGWYGAVGTDGIQVYSLNSWKRGANAPLLSQRPGVGHDFFP